MSEKEPKLTFELNNSEYEVKRDNSQLWTYLGRTAIDHVWIEHNLENDGTAVGSRFWREVFEDDEMFNRIANYMVAHNYESHISLRDVPECDVDAYVRFSSANDQELELL